MISTDLYQSILLDPAVERNADTLKIVSGYTSPGMCRRHLEDISSRKKEIKIELIAGMVPNDGIFEGDHIAFFELMEHGHLGLSIICSYIYKRPGVHSKLYLWEKNGQPVEAYLGSANYSQGAFINDNTRELLTPCAPTDALSYYNSISSDAIYCNNPDVESEVTINKIKRSSFRHPADTNVTGSAIIPMTSGGTSSEFVRLSLLDKNGEVPLRSRLNWGQRPGRDPNEAYISVPVDVMRMNFFPNRKQQFTVLTDDGKAIICVTAQSIRGGDPDDYYKAIESSANNRLLGEYFRFRLGLSSGANVQTSDIVNYGRTDVTFYKIDPETYYMDFSVNDDSSVDEYYG